MLFLLAAHRIQTPSSPSSNTNPRAAICHTTNIFLAVQDVCRLTKPSTALKQIYLWCYFSSKFSVFSLPPWQPLGTARARGMWVVNQDTPARPVTLQRSVWLWCTQALGDKHKPKGRLSPMAGQAGARCPSHVLGWDCRASRAPSRGVPWLYRRLKHTNNVFQYSFPKIASKIIWEMRVGSGCLLRFLIFTREIKELLFCPFLPEERFTAAQVHFKERGRSRSSKEPRRQRQADCKVW